jgi:ABC-2 type transport system permease protein
MPAWLRVFAENQPVSVIANAVRSLMIPEQALPFLDLDQGTLILQSIAWIAGIVAVFAPLAVRQYRRSVG